MSRARAIADIIRTVGGKEVPHKFTSAIIVAAGSSSRMGAETAKQFLELCGMPVVVHALRAYEQSELINEIIVVCREQDIPAYEEYKQKFAIKKLARIVTGGQSRQESVIKGLEAISDKAKYVAIADGARPLTTPEMIRRVLRAAYQYDAATAAVRAQDTVKCVKNGFITATVPRQEVWLAQTPQAFSVNLYRAAAYHAVETGAVATDDNSLVEAIGRSVFTVDCGKSNIKITTPEDLIIARALLEAQREV